MRTLLSLSVSTAANCVHHHLEDAEQLPAHLKMRLLHIMSKRNGLLNDETLAKMCTPCVKELDFTNSFKISDIGLCQLPKCNYLWKLDLNATGNAVRELVTSKAITHVTRMCPNLQIVYLRRCVNLTDEGIVSLAKNCLRITELNLSGCKKIGDKSVKTICSHSGELTNLNLAHTSITDESAICMSNGLFAKTLQELQFANCPNITDLAIEAILLYCTNVTYFEFQDCPQLTSDAVSAMENIRGRSSLKQINFTIPW